MKRPDLARRNFRHGYAVKGKVAPEYKIWCGMIDRCERPGSSVYRHYGGRGVRVAARWRESFAAFLSDVGPRPSPSHQIDRINSGGHYEPGNVRWATSQEQQRNRKNNVLLTIDGATKCLAGWAAEAGLKYDTFYMRLKAGWPPEVAISRPVTELRRVATK